MPPFFIYLFRLFQAYYQNFLPGRIKLSSVKADSFSLVLRTTTHNTQPGRPDGGDLCLTK